MSKRESDRKNSEYNISYKDYPWSYRASKMGAMVRARRAELDLSQGELSKQSGVSPATISNIENELTIPSIGTVMALSRSLRLNPLQLFGSGLERREESGASHSE